MFQDFAHVQIDTGENLIDLVISVRFIAGTFMRQRLRIIFGLVFGKIVLKDLRKVLLKVFLVVIVIIEVFSKNCFSASSPRVRIKLDFKRRQRILFCRFLEGGRSGGSSEVHRCGDEPAWVEKGSKRQQKKS